MLLIHPDRPGRHRGGVHHIIGALTGESLSVRSAESALLSQHVMCANKAVRCLRQYSVPSAGHARRVSPPELPVSRSASASKPTCRTGQRRAVVPSGSPTPPRRRTRRPDLAFRMPRQRCRPAFPKPTVIGARPAKSKIKVVFPDCWAPMTRCLAGRRTSRPTSHLWPALVTEADLVHRTGTGLIRSAVHVISLAVGVCVHQMRPLQQARQRPPPNQRTRS